MSTPETSEIDKAVEATAPSQRLTIARAMSTALASEMRADDRVLVLGEDIAALGGVFGNCQGLLDEFGPERVRDTPISETAFIGAAVGLAAVGMRPVVELMFVDFFGVCMDAIYNLAAKNNYFSGGQTPVPMVLMTSVGGGYGDAGQHSQCLFGTFAHLPGMKVVIPSNAYDAKGLLIAAIRDPNPVVFMYHKALQGMGWLGTEKATVVDVPDEPFTVDLGKARLCRQGDDVTLVGFGRTLHVAMEAAALLCDRGIEADVIDLRSLVPLEKQTLQESIQKTGRLVVIDDDYLSFGVTGEIIALACEMSFSSLRASPARIAHPDVPIPFSPALERPLIPSAAMVVDAVVEQLEAGQ
ncbi:MAG: alpha-ketoacid dehydrogenase subunit beta [Planctomycetota bacterium]